MHQESTTPQARGLASCSRKSLVRVSHWQKEKKAPLLLPLLACLVLTPATAGAAEPNITNAPYFGFHVGVGKEFELKNGDSVDVYGKYFFNRRNGVSFDAGGHYDLDAVTSSVLRIGARYTMKRKKWNFYGGLAYEHELDGKAGGTADGAAIRAAETKGGSVRAELGATMRPSDGSPWSLDLNVSGFAGKKQGLSGGVKMTWMF